MLPTNEQYWIQRPQRESSKCDIANNHRHRWSFELPTIVADYRKCMAMVFGVAVTAHWWYLPKNVYSNGPAADDANGDCVAPPLDDLHSDNAAVAWPQIQPFVAHFDRLHFVFAVSRYANCCDYSRVDCRPLRPMLGPMCWSKCCYCPLMVAAYCCPSNAWQTMCW